jgi:hypothetical protein
MLALAILLTSGIFSDSFGVSALLAVNGLLLRLNKIHKRL